VLERLTAPAAREETKAVEPKPQEPAMNRARLDALTKSAEPAAQSAQPEPAPTAAPAVDLSKANDKLSSLLNKPKE
jgi:hypothetical protein